MSRAVVNRLKTPLISLIIVLVKSGRSINYPVCQHGCSDDVFNGNFNKSCNTNLN